MSKPIVLLGDLGTDHQGFPPTPVIAGSPTVLVDGKPVARMGDSLAPHSKPKHPPHPRAIAAGSSTVMIDGMPAAVTGSAVSCGGVTIGSGSVVIGDTHSPVSFSGVSPVSRKAVTSAASQASATQQARQVGSAGPQSGSSTQAVGSSSTSAFTASAGSAQANAETEKDQSLSDPGFHVVRKPMSRNELIALLYGDASAKPDNFDRLNPGLGSRALPGEMIVVADPNSLECTTRENDLMQIAAQVNQEVQQLSEQEAQFIVDHYDLLEMMTANAATGLGVGATMVGQQIKSINGILKELEALHQSTFRTYGKLSHPDFFERRQKLFTKLDFALGKVTRKGMSLDDHAKLKRALGLSSKSIVHEWKSSGVGGIPGYATNYSKAAGAARFVENGGRLVIALDVGLTGYKIYEACSEGRTDQCERVGVTETLRFTGSAAGGTAGAMAAPLLCVAVGVGTAGVGGIACGIIAAGVGGAVGGKVMGDLGASAGELIYEVRSDE
ncbi:type VI secretion system PAAR protein [Marinobacter sp. CHS3-4]|uniref:type VI secretion system PAAR protein n=1 Tax=Marinobacter sp. CHS3-4 TaxID=3045174 RepID=UPI0024B56FF1|nr:type VI secretion system PAAR protein [Marinobacter sp. CHS3-4]MDI9244535.1 type VI secretion system PAAR protein [Marinobacter sp. CHS3-4]